MINSNKKCYIFLIICFNFLIVCEWVELLGMVIKWCKIVICMLDSVEE